MTYQVTGHTIGFGSVQALQPPLTRQMHFTSLHIFDQKVQILLPGVGIKPRRKKEMSSIALNFGFLSRETILTNVADSSNCSDNASTITHMCRTCSIPYFTDLIK